MAQRTVSIVIEVTGAEESIEQVRRVRSALDDLGRDGAEGLAALGRRSQDVALAMREMERSFQLRQWQQRMVGDLDGFFARILTGARSTGDLLKNIWREVAEFFKRTLEEMAGAMAASFPGASGLGLPATMPMGGLLSQLSLRGLGPFSGQEVLMGGLTLGGLTVGSRNRALSALGGLGGGALAGFSVGGPIGAAIGAVAGGLIGLLSGGGGSEKRRDAEIANQGFAQLAKILEDYQRFRRDYASTLDAAQRIWNQMQGQWVRAESARTQRPYFDAILHSIEQTEDERNRRRQWMGLMPVPEFQAGGFVQSRDHQGAVAALLHPGEFVLSQRAVERLGVGLLEGLNRGSSVAGAATAGSGGLLVEVAPAGEQWFLEALEKGIPVLLRKGGAASRALRQ